MSLRFSCYTAVSGPARWLSLTLPERILSAFLTSHPSLHLAGQTPDSLSNIFHWKPKWYSTLPIAFPVTFLSVASLHLLVKDLTGGMEVHGYLSAWDRLLWTSPLPFCCKLNSRWHQVKPHRGKSKKADVLKTISPFDEETRLQWHAEVISYLAAKDASRSLCSFKPGLCLLDANTREPLGLIVRFLKELTD